MKPRRRRRWAGPKQALGGVFVLALASLAIGGAMTAASGAPKPRGEMVDIGGRRLRMVCAGPEAASPAVILESGAFGIAADWAVVQDRRTPCAVGARRCPPSRRAA